MLNVEKELARRSLEMWAGQASIDAEAVFADDYVNHQEPAADADVGSIDRATWASIVEANHKAFPDLRVEILGQIAEDDMVATHWRFSATQSGAYEGHAPTGKRASWTGVQIDRYENGKIAESWVSWDKYTQFEQLGMLAKSSS